MSARPDGLVWTQDRVNDLLTVLERIAFALETIAIQAHNERVVRGATRRP